MKDKLHSKAIGKRIIISAIVILQIVLLSVVYFFWQTTFIVGDGDLIFILPLFCPLLFSSYMTYLYKKKNDKYLIHYFFRILTVSYILPAIASFFAIDHAITLKIQTSHFQGDEGIGYGYAEGFFIFFECVAFTVFLALTLVSYLINKFILKPTVK